MVRWRRRFQVFGCGWLFRIESGCLTGQREGEITNGDFMPLLKLLASTEQAAGTGTVLQPMKGLLARDYAFEVRNPPAREWPKLHCSVRKVDGDHRIILCELICGFIQCEISSSFKEVRKTYG